MGDGQDITALKGKALQSYRKRMQIVFQDPVASLNPRMTAGDIIAVAGIPDVGIGDTLADPNDPQALPPAGRDFAAYAGAGVVADGGDF